MLVLFFGQLTDLTAGITELEIEAAADTEQLKQLLFERYPLLRQASFAITVNQNIIRQNTPLTAQAEVALLPPFSGG